MRILFCGLDGTQPRTNGLRLAIGALLDELEGRHEVRYIGYRMPDQVSVPDRSNVRLVDQLTGPPRGFSLLRATLGGRPWEADRLAAGLRSMLDEELKTFEPEVVHVVYWALAGLGRLLAGHASVLTTFDAQHLNIDASVPMAPRLRRPLIRAEAARVKRFQADEFRRFGRIVVVSAQDRAALRALNDELEVAVIPNGVDADYYRPAHTEARDPSRIVLTGAMNYPPNIAAAELLARHVLPRVRSTLTHTHLALVGRDPAPRILDLAALPGVHVTGEVPDVRPWLRDSRVFACPMVSGTGIKNKLLEAMACGLPCVVTPLALQGLDVEPGVHLLVGKTAQELADQVVLVLRNETLARSLGQAARQYVRSSHSWSGVARSYESLYKEVQGPRSSA